jgi:hypothetical protein
MDPLRPGARLPDPALSWPQDVHAGTSAVIRCGAGAGAGMGGARRRGGRDIERAADHAA